MTVESHHHICFTIRTLTELQPMIIAHFWSRLQKGITFEIRLDDEEMTEAAEERQEEEEKVESGRAQINQIFTAPRLFSL